MTLVGLSWAGSNRGAWLSEAATLRKNIFLQVLSREQNIIKIVSTLNHFLIQVQNMGYQQNRMAILMLLLCENFVLLQVFQKQET